MEKEFCRISILAKRALIHEVLLSPKPGLVDRYNSGAHDDMDIYSFMDSVLSLENYFYKCLEAGYEYSGSGYHKILERIRPFGIRAEEKMYQMTGNVNTHKGAIFIFGILCSAIGSLNKEQIRITLESISKRSGQISNKILDDFKKDLCKVQVTYGEDQYIKYGRLGARGEAYFGFPSVVQGYKEFLACINQGYSERVAMGQSLLKLMTLVDDSNIIGRKGIEVLENLKAESLEVLNSGGYKTSQGLEKIRELDKKFIKENISPGGCADLAAASLFIYWIIKDENLVKKNDK